MAASHPIYNNLPKGLIEDYSFDRENQSATFNAKDSAGNVYEPDGQGGWQKSVQGAQTGSWTDMDGETHNYYGPTTYQAYTPESAPAFPTADPGARLIEMKWDNPGQSWGNTGIGGDNGGTAYKWSSPSGQQAKVVIGPDGNPMLQLPSDAVDGSVVDSDQNIMAGFKDLLTVAGPMILGPLAGQLSGALGTVGSKAAVGGLTSALTGGNPITGALTGAASGALSSGFNSVLPNMPAGVVPALTGGTMAALTGGDPLMSGLMAGAGGLFNSLPNLNFTMNDAGTNPLDVTVTPEPQDMTGFMQPDPFASAPQSLSRTPMADNYLNTGNVFDNTPINPPMLDFGYPLQQAQSDSYQQQQQPALSWEQPKQEPLMQTPMADNYLNTGNAFEQSNYLSTFPVFNEQGQSNHTSSPPMVDFLNQSAAATGVPAGDAFATPQTGTSNMDTDMTGFMDNLQDPQWLTNYLNGDSGATNYNLLDFPMSQNYLDNGQAFDTSGLLSGLSSGSSSSGANSGALTQMLQKIFGGGAFAGTLGGLGGGSGGGGSGGAGMSSLLLPLLGGILGSQSGSQQSGTSTTTKDIPEWLKPYVTGLFDKSKTEFESQVNNPNANSLLDPAKSVMSDTITGKYLDPSTNPWLKSTYDQAAQSVTDAYKSTTQPRTDALFNQAGAFGPQNSAYAETVARNNFGLGTNLTNLATNIYGGNYNAERTRQASAAAGAPAFTTAASGSMMAPFNQYKDILSGFGGEQVTSPNFTNPWGGALSGALTGYGASQLFK